VFTGRKHDPWTRVKWHPWSRAVLITSVTNTAREHGPCVYRALLFTQPCRTTQPGDHCICRRSEQRCYCLDCTWP